MHKWIKQIANCLFRNLPGKKYIVFESKPLFSDNTRAVYEEFVRRKLYEKYRFVWAVMKKEDDIVSIPHAKVICIADETLSQRVTKIWVFLRAEAFISCNSFLHHVLPGQYSICLMHGAPLKRVSRHYKMDDRVEEILSFSKYLMPYEAENTDSDINKMQLLGFPRNDMLFHGNADLHQLFPDVEFEKTVYWLPTFRQHSNGELDLSTIAMPILYNEDIARQVNECARRNKVLLIVKPHFVQDVSRLKNMNLSNLRFIDEAFLRQNDTLNYALLGKTDALLTDYSSVYYDYLLLDRPIGLCWDDYEVFGEREGFIVDMDIVMAGGEKIYTAEDLCMFISRVAEGTDALREARRKVCDLIQDYQDDKATERVVDHILSKLEERKK